LAIAPSQLPVRTVAHPNQQCDGVPVQYGSHKGFRLTGLQPARRLGFLSAFLTAIVLAPVSGVSAAADVTGTWLTPAGALIEIAACGKAPCGKIVRFPPPKGYTMQSTPDLNNKDESKRTRKLLGLTVIWRMTPQPDGWKARVYDPRRGFSADATLRKTGAQTLEVQGCVRVVFNVCEKETWQKAN
jgi:uncharacterized protein (DUF2147 family)